MKEPYSRVALELQGRGFTVVPDVSSELPGDSGALAIVNEALAKAEASVHLLGEKLGFAPDGLEPIVKLQLARARERAAAADQAGQSFGRLVWAPKILDSGAAAAGPATERDPVLILKRCDDQIATDKIDGDILSKFVEFLFQYLAKQAPPPDLKTPTGNQLQVYLSYNGADEDYAVVDCGSSARLLA